jgi:hypothetical protein
MSAALASRYTVIDVETSAGKGSEKVQKEEVKRVSEETAWQTEVSFASDYERMSPDLLSYIREDSSSKSQYLGNVFVALIVFVNSAGTPGEWVASLSDWTQWRPTRPMSIRPVTELFDEATQKKIKEVELTLIPKVVEKKEETQLLYRAWNDGSYWYTTSIDEAYAKGRGQKPHYLGRVLKNRLDGAVPFHCISMRDGNPKYSVLESDLDKYKGERQSIHDQLFKAMFSVVQVGHIFVISNPVRGTIPLHYLRNVADHQMKQDFMSTTKGNHFFTAVEQEVVDKQREGYKYIGIIGFIYPEDY